MKPPKKKIKRSPLHVTSLRNTQKVFIESKSLTTTFFVCSTRTWNSSTTTPTLNTAMPWPRPGSSATSAPSITLTGEPCTSISRFIVTRRTQGSTGPDLMPGASHTLSANLAAAVTNPVPRPLRLRAWRSYSRRRLFNSNLRSGNYFVITLGNPNMVEIWIANIQIMNLSEWQTFTYSVFRWLLIEFD